jgi:hypothetical protein
MFRMPYNRWHNSKIEKWACFHQTARWYISEDIKGLVFIVTHGTISQKIKRKAVFYWTKRSCIPEDERRLTFTRLRGDISQKVELFVATAVRTSDPTEVTLDMYLTAESYDGTPSCYTASIWSWISLADFPCKCRNCITTRASTDVAILLLPLAVAPSLHLARDNLTVRQAQKMGISCIVRYYRIMIFSWW